MKKVVRPAMFAFSALLFSQNASSHHSYYGYDYYRSGKVSFTDEGCQSIAYDQRVRPQWKYQDAASCLAINPAEEASQNRFVDPEGELQQNARFQADDTLVFERRHDLAADEAAVIEADLLRFAERLYVGESANLRYQEAKLILEKRIDRLQKKRHSYFKYIRIAWFKRYLKVIDRRLAYIEDIYKPYVLENIASLQDQLGKDAPVEEPVLFDYAQVDDALSLGLVSQVQYARILDKKQRVDDALVAMADRGFSCDDAVLAIRDGQADIAYNSLSEAIQGASGATTLLVGSQIPREDIALGTSLPLTVVSRCDAEINTLDLTVASDLVIDGFVFENQSQDGRATVAMQLFTSDVLFVNNRVTQNGVEGNGLLIDADNSALWLLGNEIASHQGDGVVIQNPIADESVLFINNWIHENRDNGIALMSDREVSFLRNDIEDNGSYGLARTSSGTAARVQLVENAIINNNGDIVSGVSSQDLGDYPSLLDATDSGNTTTQGTEGVGVQAP